MVISGTLYKAQAATGAFTSVSWPDPLQSRCARHNQTAGMHGISSNYGDPPSDFYMFSDRLNDRKRSLSRCVLNSWVRIV